MVPSALFVSTQAFLAVTLHLGEHRAEEKINEAHLDVEKKRFVRSRDDALRRHEHFRHGDVGGKRRVLHHGDEGVSERREGRAEGLRQDDVPHHLQIGEPRAEPRLELPRRDGFERGADRFGAVGPFVHGEDDDRGHEGIDQKARVGKPVEDDEELHKENVFCAYLLKLLPPDEVSPLDLEGKLQLEYYKLQKTFAGAIELEHTKGVYEPVTQKGALGHDPKEPLDEIILKINEKFKGEFTNADRVLLTALHDRLLADPKLAKLARSSDPQIFTESIFPKAFDTAAQDSYLEAQDTFSSLFEDTSKYKAIMSALAEWLYGEFRKK